MAKGPKRRPLRPAKTPIATSSSEQQPTKYQASTIIHPPTSTTHIPKRRVARAHQKHTPSPSFTLPPPSPPTLGDRFHALPPELRAHIFGHLLIRPVKWQLPHLIYEPESCPLLVSNDTLSPRIQITQPPSHNNPNTCIRCCGGHWHNRAPLWQRHDPPRKTWSNPWRSQWAPPVRNEFMCSDCWDDEFRPRPHPAQARHHLKCLCARRENLGVLLVCKRWYEEAGRIFYTRNIFAFEDAATFQAFTSNLSPRWRDMVTGISIMAHHPEAPDSSASSEERSSGWESSRKLKPIWSLLRQFPSLSYLELDAHFLSRASTVRSMLRLGLLNLRRINFTLHKPRPTVLQFREGCKWIYPEYHSPRLLAGGLAEEVGRAIKGQRRLWLKKPGAVERAVEIEGELHERVMGMDKEDNGMEERNRVYYCANVEEWTRLVWKYGWRAVGGAYV